MLKVSSLILLLITGSIAVVGCGSGPAPDAKVEANRLDKLTAIRALYDKADGNYDSLSADDKAQFLKLCDGSQQEADTTWDAMKQRGGKPAPPTATK